MELTTILETERLQVRAFTVADVQFIIALVNSPGWIEFIGDRNIKTEADATVYLEKGPIKSYELFGYGLYMVELKQHSAPVGMCGFIWREWLQAPDIGFAFLPEYTGYGYASEVSQALIQYARNELKLPELFAITLPNNTKSIKLLEKLGMKFIKVVQTDKANELLSLYGISLAADAIKQ